MPRTKQGIICILVARGGIEPPTQGFSTPLLDSTSLLNQKVNPTMSKLCVKNLRTKKIDRVYVTDLLTKIDRYIFE
jgi:hypothetical protein